MDSKGLNESSAPSEACSLKQKAVFAPPGLELVPLPVLEKLTTPPVVALIKFRAKTKTPINSNVGSFHTQHHTFIDQLIKDIKSNLKLLSFLSLAKFYSFTIHNTLDDIGKEMLYIESINDKCELEENYFLRHLLFRILHLNVLYSREVVFYATRSPVHPFRVIDLSLLTSSAARFVTTGLAVFWLKKVMMLR